ncbi:APC family permease [Mucilaginibacter sp.]
MEAEKTNEGLHRVIGVRGLAATIINNTIGSGIYVLPAIVSIQMGAAGIFGYLFCGIMLVCIMLCYSEIGSKISKSGGSYIYVETAFGPFWGFIVSWLFFFGYGILGSAAMMNVVADAMAVIFPVFKSPLIRALLYFLLLGTMALVNVRGVKRGVHFIQFLTVVKLLPLIAIIFLGFSHIQISNFHAGPLPSIKTSGETVLVLFWAFVGFETSLSVSGEIKDSGQTVPRAILLGAGMVFIFYILIQIVVQGVLGAQVGQFKNAPLAAVADHIIGPAGATLLLVFTMISCFGNTSGDVMATPRLLFAGAKDGLFPKQLAKMHPKFATPYIAVITYATLIFIFAVSGGFRELAVLASGCLLLVYLGVVLAMLKLRTNKTEPGKKTFKVPGGYLIPIFAIAAIIWLLISLSTKEIISTAIFIAIIGLVYFVMKRFRNKQ